MHIPLISWDGTKPVPVGTLVVIQYRDGDTNCGMSNDFNWEHKQTRTDIIAYQIMGAQVRQQAIDEIKAINKPLLDLLANVLPYLKAHDSNTMGRRERNKLDAIIITAEDALEQDGRSL